MNYPSDGTERPVADGIGVCVVRWEAALVGGRMTERTAVCGSDILSQYRGTIWALGRLECQPGAAIHSVPGTETGRNVVRCHGHAPMEGRRGDMAAHPAILVFHIDVATDTSSLSACGVFVVACFRQRVRGSRMRPPHRPDSTRQGQRSGSRWNTDR